MHPKGNGSTLDYATKRRRTSNGYVRKFYESRKAATGISVVDRIFITGIFYHVHKALLRQRGIIRKATVRSPAPPVDALTQRELTETLAELYPHPITN